MTAVHQKSALQPIRHEHIESQPESLIASAKEWVEQVLEQMVLGNGG